MPFMLLGAKPIFDFTDQTKEAKFATQIYVNVRKEVLRMADWNCAKKFSALAQLATPPLVKYSVAYQMPADFIRLVDAYTSGAMTPITDFRYELWGDNTLLCDQSDIVIEYIKDVDDPTRLDSLCFRTMAFYMAYLLSYPLLQSSSRSKEMSDAFTAMLKMARTTNSRENSNITMTAELFLQSRLAGPLPVIGSQDSQDILAGQ